jgi:hypothetical protein
MCFYPIRGIPGQGSLGHLKKKNASIFCKQANTPTRHTANIGGTAITRSSFRYLFQICGKGNCDPVNSSKEVAQTAGRYERPILQLPLNNQHSVVPSELCKIDAKPWGLPRYLTEPSYALNSRPRNTLCAQC